MTENLSVYVSDEEEATLLAEFDDVFAGEKRSAKIKDAMALYLRVEEALRAVELEDIDEDSKQRYLSSLIRSDDA